MVIKKCLICKKKFKTFLCRNAKYCSRKCFWKADKQPAWNKEKKWSQEVKEKMSLAKQGYIPWIKGKKHSEETKKKISKAGLGRKLSEITKRRMKIRMTGNKINLGRKQPIEERKKRSKIAKEKGYGKWMKGKPGNAGSFKKGETAGNKSKTWKGGITPLNKVIRGRSEMFEWKKAVFKRDDYICQKCEQRGEKLNADHFPIMFFQIIENNKITNLKNALQCNLLWDVNNGRTLCEKCHKKITKKQMKIHWKNQFSKSSEITKQLNNYTHYAK